MKPRLKNFFSELNDLDQYMVELFKEDCKKIVIGDVVVLKSCNKDLAERLAIFLGIAHDESFSFFYTRNGIEKLDGKDEIFLRKVVSFS